MISFSCPSSSLSFCCFVSISLPSHLLKGDTTSSFAIVSSSDRTSPRSSQSVLLISSRNTSKVRFSFIKEALEEALKELLKEVLEELLKELLEESLEEGREENTDKGG